MIKQEQRTPTSKHLPSLQVSVFLFSRKTDFFRIIIMQNTLHEISIKKNILRKISKKYS